MRMKLLATAAFALSLTAGAAFAQQNSDSTGQTAPAETGGGMTTTGESSGAAPTGGAATTATQAEQSGAQGTANPAYASDDERMLYENNRAMMSGFFTDETMMTPKSDAEVKSAFEAMGADDQASMKRACEQAMQNRGSYGSVTISLCQQAGVTM